MRVVRMVGLRWFVVYGLDADGVCPGLARSWRRPLNNFSKGSRFSVFDPRGAEPTGTTQESLEMTPR
jgi:hypothetical protein